MNHERAAEGRAQRFEAIICDFDGVIVDSEAIANAAMAEVLTGLGHEVTAEQAIARFSGLRWTDCHQRIVAESGIALDRDTLGEMVDAAVAARVVEMPAVPGVADFLGRRRDRRLAIASSSETAWLAATLTRLGLAGHFGDRLFSAAGFARGKPHPDIYLHAASRLGLAPGKCLVIEDHPVGVAAGLAAGMTVIALLAASHIRGDHAARVRAAGARHLAHSWREVDDIIDFLEHGATS